MLIWLPRLCVNKLDAKRPAASQIDLKNATRIGRIRLIPKVFAQSRLFRLLRQRNTAGTAQVLWRSPNATNIAGSVADSSDAGL